MRLAEWGERQLQGAPHIVAGACSEAKTGRRVDRSALNEAMFPKREACLAAEKALTTTLPKRVSCAARRCGGCDCGREARRRAF